MAHCERTIISVKYQMVCVERKLDEQTDSHSGYSAHLRLVRSILTVIDNLDLHLFKSNIYFVFFNSFLDFRFNVFQELWAF